MNQTPLQSRSVHSEIPEANWVKRMSESESTYLKTPRCTYTCTYLKGERAGDEGGGGTVSGQAGRRGRRGGHAVRTPKRDMRCPVPVGGQHTSADYITAEGTYLASRTYEILKELTKYPRETGIHSS